MHHRVAPTIKKINLLNSQQKALISRILGCQIPKQYKSLKEMELPPFKQILPIRIRLIAMHQQSRSMQYIQPNSQLKWIQIAKTMITTSLD